MTSEDFGTDLALIEEAFCVVLAEQGVDGRHFFRNLASGIALGPALGVTPAIEEQLYERAHRWFAVGRTERAEPLFRALCTAQPGDANYWVGLGVCLRMREDIAGAALALEQARALRPDWAVPAFHHAELLLRAGDIEGASQELARFNALRDGETPEAMSAEAAKLKEAIAFRRTEKTRSGK